MRCRPAEFRAKDDAALSVQVNDDVDVLLCIPCFTHQLIMPGDSVLIPIQALRVVVPAMGRPGFSNIRSWLVECMLWTTSHRVDAVLRLRTPRGSHYAAATSHG